MASYIHNIYSILTISIIIY